MKKALTLLLVFSSLFCFSQTKVGRVELPDQMLVNNQQLQLEGAGTRVKLWMDMYAMGLYLSHKMKDATKIINNDENMAIRLEIISGLITSEKMEKACREGFTNSTSGEMENIKQEIEDFISVFQNSIEKKDVFEFVYLPSEGTQIYKNGKLQQNIRGLAFKQALFGIWLCNTPVDKNLKKNLLE
ncbi:chalcone isomerase family protein [Labilibaculum sp.]|uniref:chalcone isomerase family protein n=1 Tax=Labilibaculum sp. TaxID=2060723 RepID=UPI003565EAFF